MYVACTALVRALDDHPPNLGGPLPSPGGHWAAGGAVGSYIGVDGHIIYLYILKDFIDSLNDVTEFPKDFTYFLKTSNVSLRTS